MVSSSALALTAMTDSNMKEATGQAGVSIALDDVTLYQSIGKTIYRDLDGKAGNTADAAGVFISGAETLTTIRAIFAGEGTRGGFLAKNYDTIASDNSLTFTSKALTIDVANTCTLMTDGKNYNLDTYIANNGGTTGGGYDALGAELEEKGVKKLFSAAKAGDLTAQGALGAAAPAATDTWETWSAETYVTDINGIAPGEAGYIPTYGANANYLTAAGVANALMTDHTSFAAYAEALDTKLAVAGVVIGLPTIEIRKSGSLKTIGVTSASTATETYNSDEAFIAIKKSDSTLAILDGVIEICPHP
jgi:hypothetical protein